MIALATLNKILERSLAAAKKPDDARSERLAAHKRSRFAALTPDSFADVTHTRILDSYRFITAHVALPCPIHGEPLTDEQLGQGLGDLAIETEKSAVWFLVVVVIAAAALVDGCSCPSGHSGGAPNNPGTQPFGGGKP
ncbi:hypothetical protein [Nannocystis punicea]|uniref:Uncharacterized protein n=1 Tax=Nannocystis punicea TaxID=2995304 RepID=A0ABY7HIU4_9BACT|nr:hypothetical protein [Nannocystis poenicansa]WAS99237.1 hypothetical protein O0S08_24170 [Nannocystis poenicansa]